MTMQSEPSEAMIEAGRNAWADWAETDLPHDHTEPFRSIYLAMKALDRDFAARTDSSTDALIEQLREGEWWQAVVRGSNPTGFSTDQTEAVRKAADRLAALPPITDSSTDAVEAEKWDIVRAYVAGATDAHNNWEEDRDPDFTEAGLDYYANLDEAALPLSGAVERLRELVRESLFHLRLDDGAKGYHDRAVAALRNSTDGETK